MYSDQNQVDASHYMFENAGVEIEQFDLNNLYEFKEEFINSIDNEINKIEEKNKQKIKK